MTDPIKRALTRRPNQHNQQLTEEPNQNLVTGIKFALTLTITLAALEIAHMTLIGTWNSEIFAALTGLSGTITGIFVGQKT